MRKFVVILILSPLFSAAQFPSLPSTFGFNKPQGGLITYLYDTFTDANGTNLNAHTMNVGSGWTQRTDGLCAGLIAMTIQSNAAKPSAGVLSAYTAEAGVSDYVISVDAIIPNQSDYLVGVLVRWTTCADFWVIVIERDGSGTPYMAIIDSQAGTRSYRSTVNVPAATSSTLNIKVTLSGNSIVALAGTGETCNYSSSFNSTATKAGLMGYDSSPYTPAIPVDNFLVTNQ